uniref:DUF4817 domain-containing protein n=1 Tax=Trichogramma kaykai TaxID=54128 RepID=A0ABD2X5P4_9HYME
MNMVLLYGQCNMNAAAAAREYAFQFGRPGVRLPSRNVILAAVNRGFEDGNLIPVLHRGHGQGVCNALTKTSSAQCFTCEATNSTLNNLETIISRLTNKKALKYGFPVLHAWIRFMEFVLHVSYRLKLTKKLWQVNTSIYYYRLHCWYC